MGLSSQCPERPTPANRRSVGRDAAGVELPGEQGGGCRVSAETQVGQAPRNPHPRGIGVDLKVLVGGRGPGSFLMWISVVEPFGAEIVLTSDEPEIGVRQQSQLSRRSRCFFGIKVARCGVPSWRCRWGVGSWRTTRLRRRSLACLIGESLCVIRWRGCFDRVSPRLSGAGARRRLPVMDRSTQPPIGAEIAAELSEDSRRFHQINAQRSSSTTTPTTPCARSLASADARQRRSRFVCIALDGGSRHTSTRWRHPMADRWPDLVRDFDRLTVTADLRDKSSGDDHGITRPRILQESTSGTARPGHRRSLRRGCRRVVLVIAAHSRKDASVPGNGVEIVNPRDTHVTTSIIGGSPGLRQAIHDSLAGIGHSTIKTVAVVQAAKTSLGTRSHTRSRSLNFSYPKSPRAQAAYASSAGRTRRRGHPRPRNRTGTRTGRLLPTRGCGVRLVEARIPSRSANSPTAAELIAHARRAARKLGVTTSTSPSSSHTASPPQPIWTYETWPSTSPSTRPCSRTRHFPQRILSDSGAATEIDGTYVELRYRRATAPPTT